MKNLNEMTDAEIVEFLEANPGCVLCMARRDIDSLRRSVEERLSTFPTESGSSSFMGFRILPSPFVLPGEVWFVNPDGRLLGKIINVDMPPVKELTWWDRFNMLPRPHSRVTAE